MAVHYWIKKSKPSLLVIIFSISLLMGCVGNGKIKGHASQPLPHPKLAEMQSFSLQEKENVTYFAKSEKYYKNGILVVILRGEPYEIGYTRGALLRDEIREWVSESLDTIKKKSLETSFEKRLLQKRAKEVEAFMPPEYREELQGLSAGSGIDYDVLLVMNVLAAISIDVACTSVVVRTSDNSLLRSRNLDLYDAPALPAGLYFYKPTNGHAFVSISHLPGFIGTRTAFNESGLNIGAHDISRISKKYVKGEPDFILRREAAQYAGSVKEAAQILKKAHRSLSKMWLVADSKTANIYEFNSEEIASYEMVDDYLILTNHTRMLNIGGISKSSFDRYNEVKTFLDKHRGEMNTEKLIDLNRGNEICFTKYPKVNNLHSAIFKANTLDFWIAAGAPPATRGKWIGFNLNKELYGRGNDPEPLIVPAVR
jgi:Acyl-coenzyme A:6-aminopenicillanic acid acyl-transferase